MSEVTQLTKQKLFSVNMKGCKFHFLWFQSHLSSSFPNYPLDRHTSDIGTIYEAKNILI